ncbi:hypothetical protein R1flu_026324 [Riccia fluitans]|uniref:Secreted protein n=1 Tax=Riccia fluitans TaxID=41844 RepID=A0ABD1XIM2_9MARC
MMLQSVLLSGVLLLVVTCDTTWVSDIHRIASVFVRSVISVTMPEYWASRQAAISITSKSLEGNLQPIHGGVGWRP